MRCRTGETSLFVPDLGDAFFLGLSHLPLAVVLCEFPWARGQRISTPADPNPHAHTEQTCMYMHTEVIRGNIKETLQRGRCRLTRRDEAA